VSDDAPFARLPPSIELSLDEVTAVLEALDIAEIAARSDSERAAVRAAIGIISLKLGPELGDLL
jgi:hypothetical protein